MEYSRDFNIFINGIQNNLTPIFSKVSKTKGRRDPLPRKIQNCLILSRDEQSISTPSFHDGL